MTRLARQLKKRGGFSTPQQAVVVGLLRTNDRFQYRFAQLFREHELTQPQYNVLTILRGAGEALPVLEIRERLVARTAAVTGLVDKLVGRGLVTREQCPDDRRVWYVDLTAAGRRLVEQMDEPVQAMHRTLCKGLSAAECRELSRLLDKAAAID